MKNPQYREGPAYGRLGVARTWALLLGVPIVCLCAVVAFSSVTMPMPGYWADTLQMAHQGWMSERFTPSGYPLTMALGARLTPHAPAAGFVLEQAVLHLITVIVLWAVMRSLGATPRAALVGSLLLQADPEILLSVTKVWDVAFSTLLLLLLVLLMLRLLQRGSTVGGSALLGAAFAFSCFERPNFLFLAPVLLWSIWRGTRAHAPVSPPSTIAGRFTVVLLTASIVYASSSYVAYREVRLPGNGPYNLFAGNNPFAERALLDHLNAEPSILPALAADHVLLGNRTPDDASLRLFYTRSAREFALQHPAAETRLVAVKLWTLFRPDTKVHSIASWPGVGKALLAVFVPFWLIVVIARRQGPDWAEHDNLVVFTALLYIVPFLITNSDPRFRTPLDMLLAAHVVALLWRGSELTTNLQKPAFAGETNNTV